MAQASGYDAVKRTLDAVTAGTLLVCTLPVQAVIAALVLKNLGRPVLFRQDRPGKDGATFSLLKFRSMENIDHTKADTSDAGRLTPFGRVLRSSSLDELPSLWNVVKGDVSLVGPRPLLVRYLDRYTPEQARRHEVRPGITGLAQVSGRNAIGWDEKFRLDVKYVDSRSLKLDLWIVTTTIVKVFRREGITEDGGATMSEFMGAAELDNSSNQTRGTLSVN